MTKRSRNIRALVTGAGSVLQVFRNTLVKRFPRGVYLCFDTETEESVVHISTEPFASQVLLEDSYDCVLYLFSEEDSGKDKRGLTAFKRLVTKCQLPIIAVLPSRQPVLERALPRLGAAEIFLGEDSKSWELRLVSAIEQHELVLETLAETPGAPTTIHELVQSELQLRKLVQLSRDIIWSVDAEGRWSFVNEAVTDILGYQPQEMIGRRFTEFQDPKHAARDLVAFSNVLDGKKYLDYETTYRHKNGSSVILSFNAVVLYGEKDEPLGATGTAMNISSKRKAAEDLREQKEFFRKLVNANPNPIAVRNLRGQFVLVNKSFAHCIGFEIDELIGLTYDEVIRDNKFLQDIKKGDAILLQNPSEEYVSERMILDVTTGEERWYQTTKKMLFIPPGDKKYFLDVSVDLSQRRHAEEALKNVIEGTAAATAEDYFQLLVEHLGSALNVSRVYILGVNEEADALELIAYSPRTNLNDETGSVTLPLDAPLFQKLAEVSLVTINEKLQDYLPKSLHQGTTSLMASLLKDPKGEPIGLIGVASEKQFEDAELHQYLLTLFGQRASAELARIQSEKETKKLERQLLQAQKMEAIGTLAAGVAHDLNNALGAVTGHLQLIEDQDNISDDQRHSLHVALDGCSRASSLIHQLLGFSRQGRYMPEQVHVRDALAEMIDFLNCATRKNVTVTTQRIPSDLYVHADKNQLQQVLMNLIINAQQAMPDGGLISVEATTNFVKLPEQYNPDAAQGEYTIISVSDTGLGIDPIIQDKIFEPFFTTKPSQMGTGLGLSMVYGIMQHHGGWVKLHSVQGEGSTFSLYFPRTVAIKEVSRDLTLRPAEAEPLVLVIDDEPFLVDLTCRFLERSGFRAKGFTAPLAALNWFRNHAEEVSLTILDMKMPQRDGKSCYREIRNINPEAAVVILSGYIHDEAATEVMNEGVLRYFQKPLRYSELIDWVRNHLAEEQAMIQKIESA